MERQEGWREGKRKGKEIPASQSFDIVAQDLIIHCSYSTYLRNLREDF
jgi:hypothetical protein